MNWLRRLFPVKHDALGGADVSRQGLVALPEGGVGAFVHIWPRSYHDRDAFLHSLAQLRAKLETLPAGAEPVWAPYPRSDQWFVVWSAKGDTRRVLEGAARVAKHLAPLCTYPPRLVTDPSLARDVRQWWRPGRPTTWRIEYGGEAWDFTWSPGRATYARVGTSSTLPRPARPPLPG